MSDKLFIDAFINRSLAEDVGSGDHTSLACIPSGASNKAHLLVKENGIIAGVDLARQVFSNVDSGIVFEQYLNDGDVVKNTDVVFSVKGSARSILTAERLVLNCMQRMSGIATYTNKLVKLCEGSKAKVVDTRKTTPLFRFIEKWAVRIGGGSNHRFGLYDMILIKDNHIDFAGGIKQVLDATRKYLEQHQLDLKIEIETRNLEELNQVLEIGGIHRIMFDNYAPEKIVEALSMIDGRYETEASGGIDANNIRQYALTGVDYISVGALTHSVKSIDLSLKAVKYGN